MSRLRDENEQVTTAYEELEEKYRPFLDQVDSLEDLNKLLQSQTSLAQSEAEKFGQLYAKVLGHQNQKQKIQYVKKLREENMSLKQVCHVCCALISVKPPPPHCGIHKVQKPTYVLHFTIVGLQGIYK